MNIPKEILELTLWNVSMKRTQRECSSRAANYIEWQIDTNKAVIAELKLMA